MASVTTNKNKIGEIISYRFRCCTGRDRKVKQEFATKTVLPPKDLTPAKALKQMQLEADLWEQSIAKGITPSKKQTYQSFLEDIWFPLHVEDGSHKPTTKKFYKDLSVRLIDWFGRCEMNNLKALDIERFISHLRTVRVAQTKNNPEGKCISDATIRHYVNLLNQQFAFAEKHEIIERSPMRKIDSVKCVKKPVDFLSPEQAKTFLNALDTAPLRWRCMMTLMLSSGIRRGEAVGLQWEDINFDAGSLSIKRSVSYTSTSGVVVGTPKSRNSVRELPLPNHMLQLLKIWKSEQYRDCKRVEMPLCTYVFGYVQKPFEPMFPTDLTLWLKRFIKANDFPDVSPHDLRHTCGSLLLMSGASIKDTQDILGHEDAKTTLTFYAGTTMESLRKASDSLSEVLNIK